MDIHECSFCKTEMELGTGKMFVKRDGSLFYFCSSKCEKNMLKLRRVARKTEWTKPLKAKKPVKEEEPKAVKKEEPKKTKKKVPKKKATKSKKTPAKTKGGKKKGASS